MLTPSVLADTLIIATLLLMAGHTLVLILHGRWLAFDPLNMFWAGIGMVYVVQPISHFQSLLAWHPPGVLEETLAWLFFALLLVIWGYESRAGVRLGHRLPPMPARLSSPKLAAMSIATISVGLIGYMYVFASAGGLRNWLAAARGGTSYEAVFGYLAQLTIFLEIGVSLLVLHINIHRVNPLARLAGWSAGCLLLLWVAYLGSRSRTIAFTLVLLLAYYLPRRRNPPAWLLGTCFVLLFLFTSFQVLYRGQFRDLSFNVRQIDPEEASERILPTWAGGDRFSQTEQYTPGAEFNVVMTTVQLVPEVVPYNFGFGYLEFFTRLVPRRFWTDKRYPGLEAHQGVLRALPNPSPAMVRDTGLIMGPAFTFVGHWYYIGGPVALLAGAFATGVMFRFIRTVYDRQPGNEGDTLLFSQLFLIGFTEAAATPTGWIYSLPFSLLVLLAVYRFCRVGRRRARAAHAGGKALGLFRAVE